MDMTHKYSQYEEYFYIYRINFYRLLVEYSNIPPNIIHQYKHRYIRIFVPKEVDDIQPNISGKLLTDLIDIRDEILKYVNEFDNFINEFTHNLSRINHHSQRITNKLDNLNKFYEKYTNDSNICIRPTNVEHIWFEYINQYNSLNK